MTRPATTTHTYPVTGNAFGLPLLIISALQLIVVLDGTVVNLALARIQVELGLTDSLRSWIVRVCHDDGVGVSVGAGCRRGFD